MAVSTDSTKTGVVPTDNVSFGTVTATGAGRFNGGLGINIDPSTTNIANFVLNQNASTRMYLGNTTVGGSADTRFVIESATDVCSFVVDAAATFLSGSAFSGLNFNQSGAKVINFRTNAVVAMTITGAQSVVAGPTITTSSTDGFLYIASAAGVPSGTPTSQSGHVALYYDTSNNKFYVYNGAWKSVTLT